MAVKKLLLRIKHNPLLYDSDNNFFRNMDLDKNELQVKLTAFCLS